MLDDTALEFRPLGLGERHRRCVIGSAIPGFLYERQAVLESKSINSQGSERYGDGTILSLSMSSFFVGPQFRNPGSDLMESFHGPLTRRTSGKLSR
ncbi:MAG TPA: hypothetical protein PK752_23760 [Accumulibacter sp.]|uniref:hypothetical protein n=1 Tax=Accumulibacter sp. TaxID=2053492 RepID=UPI002B6ADD8E|nr:hypothetical protein [Accumulibacter sp.]HRD91244.1 hypothetical protein [Accumulibacter sp.]